jgi:Uma2 family endonuclease
VRVKSPTSRDMTCIVENKKVRCEKDISIICDKSKIDDRGCKGSPDLVVEIVSPSTASIDYIEKLSLYEKYGVKEYWIIHPVDEIVIIYTLEDNMKYGRPDIYSKENSVIVGIFQDLTIDLKKVFRA